MENEENDLGLGFNNILDDDDINNPFAQNEDLDSPEDNEDNKPKDEPKDDKEEKDTAETTPDKESLFGESESVGGEENNKENEEDADSDSSKASPNFFSSMAKTLAEEGIFPDLDDETASKVQTAKDFRKMFEDQAKSLQDENTKRITELLDSGVEPSVIKQYEGTINYLNSITEKQLSSESDEGENLRKRLIYQDYINRGFSSDRAKREVSKSITNATDIDDAKEAYSSNKSFFENSYKEEINKAIESQKAEELELEQRATRIKDLTINSDKLLDGLDADKNLREKAFDAVSKPIYRDPKTGDYLTALQKLEHDDSETFLAKLGLLYTMTDGFTSVKKLVDVKAKKEIKKGFSELEKRINNTSRRPDGSLKFATGSDDKDSFISKGMKLDL